MLMELLSRLADEDNIAPEHIESFLGGERPVGPSIAFALSRVLGTSAVLWLNLQRHYAKAHNHALAGAVYRPGVERSLVDEIVTGADDNRRYSAMRLLGESSTLGTIGQACLANVAFEAVSPRELKEALQNLAAHNHAASGLIACSQSYHPDPDIAAEALYILYGVCPEQGLRKAFDEHRCARPLFREAAGTVLYLYLRTEPLLNGVSERTDGWQNVAMCFLQDLLQSGNGDYNFIQPEGCIFPQQVQACRTYATGSTAERKEAIEFLRESTPETATLLKLATILNHIGNKTI